MSELHVFYQIAPINNCPEHVETLTIDVYNFDTFQTGSGGFPTVDHLKVGVMAHLSKSMCEIVWRLMANTRCTIDIQRFDPELIGDVTLQPSLTSLSLSNMCFESLDWSEVKNLDYLKLNDVLIRNPLPIPRGDSNEIQ